MARFEANPCDCIRAIRTAQAARPRRASLEQNDAAEAVQMLDATPKKASESPIKRECIAMLERRSLKVP